MYAVLAFSLLQYRKAAELQDDTCVTNLPQQSHMWSVSVSEPVQFGNLSAVW